MSAREIWPKPSGDAGMAKPAAHRAVPDGVIDMLRDIRLAVIEIYPGGYDPVRGQHAKDEAIRGLDRLLGSR